MGKVRGWVAYTFVKAVRRSQGIEYPPGHDRRHTLNVVLQTPGPLHSDMGFRWGFGSPLPYTSIVGQWDHREYRPGDPLRRIHWRSSARHGELIVREFEPPGVQTLGIFCDPSPSTPEVAACSA